MLQQSCPGFQLGNRKLWAGITSLKQVNETSIFPRGFFVNFNDLDLDLAPSPPEGILIASFANARIYEHLLLNGMAQE